jgi:hypothetical protein
MIVTLSAGAEGELRLRNEEQGGGNRSERQVIAGQHHVVTIMMLVAVTSSAAPAPHLLLTASQEHRQSDEEGLRAQQPADKRSVRSPSPHCSNFTLKSSCETVAISLLTSR